MEWISGALPFKSSHTAFKASTVLGRIGEPSDIAGIVANLVAPTRAG
ncbi:hypothetical protein [Geobacter metallireducens]|nr:hypothetical protein [Geobacter metallireducens]